MLSLAASGLSTKLKARPKSNRRQQAPRIIGVLVLEKRLQPARTLQTKRQLLSPSHQKMARGSQIALTTQALAALQQLQQIPLPLQRRMPRKLARHQSQNKAPSITTNPHRCSNGLFLQHKTRTVLAPMLLFLRRRRGGQRPQGNRSRRSKSSTAIACRYRK